LDEKSKGIDPKRRERNRTLARESRQRKKEYIQSLESEIESLRSQVGQVSSNLHNFFKITELIFCQNFIFLLMILNPTKIVLC